VLQVLEGHLLADPRVGAAAGLVPVPPQVSTNDKASCEIEDFFECKNVQWYNWPEGTIFYGAGHLHSTYLYRKYAATYRTDLSPVGHCEETFHTMEIVRNGFSLVIDTNIRTWHCRCQTGGIRTHTNVAHYESDWQKFEAWAKTLPFKFRRTCNVIAMHGQGDVFAALTASNHIIDFQRKHGNRVRFICRKNDVPLFSKFIDDDVSVCTPEVAAQYELRHNGEIYGWMLRDKFTGGLVNAFKHYYTEGYPTWLGY
jgi:hypothetical protein